MQNKNDLSQKWAGESSVYASDFRRRPLAYQWNCARISSISQFRSKRPHSGGLRLPLGHRPGVRAMLVGILRACSAFLFAVCVLVFLEATACGQTRVRPGRTPATRLPISRTTFGRADLSQQDRKAFDEIGGLLGKVATGLVTVIAENEGEAPSTATGIIVDANGLIATSWHTLSSRLLTDILVVPPGGKPVRARLLAVDEKLDLVILKPGADFVVAHVFSGVLSDNVRQGTPALTVGYPVPPRLSVFRTTVRGQRTVQEMPKAIGERFPLRHAYKYIEIDAGVCYGTVGGPLFDDSGNVLGLCALREDEDKPGFAIEWKAIADMVSKARGAQQISLASLRDSASAGIARKLLGLPGITDQVYGSLRDRKSKVFCSKCGGYATVEQTIYETRYEPPVSAGIFIKPGKTVEVPVKTIQVTCPTCHGGRITAEPGDAYDALCEIASRLVNLDQNCWKAGEAWDDGCDALERTAFDDAIYAGDLNAKAEMALADPNSSLGKPVVFFGAVAEVRAAGDFSLLLMNVSGRAAMVFYRGKVDDLKEAHCQVAGIISGVEGSTPLVLAATVVPVHTPNPAYKSTRPRSRVPRLAPDQNQSPTPQESNSAGDLLRTAKLFIQGKLRARAIEVLRDLTQKYPKSEEANEAKDLLKDLGAEK